MRLTLRTDLSSLAGNVTQFLALVGEERWFKRADQLDADGRRSPNEAQIVGHYHWLEMEISLQREVLRTRGALDAELLTPPSLAALRFAGTTVELHGQLSPAGRRSLDGRLRDALQAETGYASLYLELDLAQRLASAGYDVDFPDLEGTGRYDLAFSRSSTVGEVECKSLSTDAGRSIHRKDFYRFVDAVMPPLATLADLGRKDVLLVILRQRLLTRIVDQQELRAAVLTMLRQRGKTVWEGSSFRIEQRDYPDCLGRAPAGDERALYAACQQAFGANCHVAGAVTPDSGCLLVMRSERDDDTSKPLLEAMRKAASQFSGRRPSFIAVQFDDIRPADLMLPHFRRRVGILSEALFGHYGARHVNATYFCGFRTAIAHADGIGAPAFSVLNAQPTFPMSPSDATPFLGHVPDEEFARLIGAVLPAPAMPDIPLTGP